MNQFFLGLGILIAFELFGVYLLYKAHKTLKLQLNGRLTELLGVTKALARANGIAEGRAAEQKEHERKVDFVEDPYYNSELHAHK